MSANNQIIPYGAAIFAPLPPHPPGGVGSISAMLFQSLGNDSSGVKFSSPVQKNSASSFSIRPVANIFKLIALSIGIKMGGRVLIFTSAYASFYEKIFWAILIICTCRKPVVVSVDGNFPNFWINTPGFLRWFFRNLITYSGLIFVCQSQNWQNYFKTIFPGANICVVGATCAEDFFVAPIVNGSRTQESIKLLYIGWVIREKGVLDLLDAIAILAKKVSHFHLDIVGPVFDESQYWLNEVAGRGLQSKVNFIGSVSSKAELIKLLDDSTIFVFPSHFEGFPVVLLEAIARGCPCIGTNIGGIPDILNDGQAGLIVEAHNPMQLADALLNLLDNPQLMDALSINAYSRAREVYSYQKCIDSYCRILNVNHMSEIAN